MPTYAAYEQINDGTWFRLGTFTGPAGSVRAVTRAFAKKHPRVDLARVQFAVRRKVMGRYVDGERLPADPG